MILKKTYVRDVVKELCSNGHRESGSEANCKARNYLVENLGQLGVEPLFDPNYTHEFYVPSFMRNFANVAGIIRSESNSDNAIVLGAHYDTCGNQPGADDNAAGVAALLRAIPMLKKPKNKSIILCFFDSEEPPHFLGPHMGSVRLFEDYLSKNYNIEAAVILDCIGHDLPINGMEDVIFAVGTESSKKLSRIVDDLTNRHDNPSKTWCKRIVDGLTDRHDLAMIAVHNDYVGDLSDHHVFRINDIANMFLTCGRTDRYHTESDTPDWLNYRKIENVSDLIVSISDALTAEGTVIDNEKHDTLSLELRTLNKVLTQRLMRIFGLKSKPTTREELTQLVNILRNVF